MLRNGRRPSGPSEAMTLSWPSRPMRSRLESWRNVSADILHKNEYSYTTRGLRRHRLFRIRVGPSARPARWREETIAAAAQQRERRVPRSERRLSSVGGQRRLSLRELLLAEDEGRRCGCRLLCHAARVLARACPAGHQSGLSRD